MNITIAELFSGFVYALGSFFQSLYDIFRGSLLIPDVSFFSVPGLVFLILCLIALFLIYHLAVYTFKFVLRCLGL